MVRIFQFVFGVLFQVLQVLFDHLVFRQSGNPASRQSGSQVSWQKKCWVVCHQRGVSMLNLVVASAILTTVALASVYLLTSSRRVLKSMSPSQQCHTLANNVIQRISSVGDRLYGYDNPDGGPFGFTPHPVNNPQDGSKAFDPGHYPTNKFSVVEKLEATRPWVNTGVDIINVTPGLIEIGNASLLINSANFLQHLYNSNRAYCTGNPGMQLSKTHKLFEGFMPDSLNMKKFYLKIEAIDLTSMEPFDCLDGGSRPLKCRYSEESGYSYYSEPPGCPKNSAGHRLILTRPMQPDEGSLKIAPNVRVHGREDVGFKATVSVEYNKGSQNMSCESHRIYKHPLDTMRPKICDTNCAISISSDAQSLGTFTGDPGIDDDDDERTRRTSCDSHGSGYDNVTIKIPVKKPSEFALVWICRTKTTTNSEGVGGSFGDWSLCKDVKFDGQTGSTTPTYGASFYELKFEGLPGDRRFDLDLRLIDASGQFSELKSVYFYIDVSRPVSHVGVNRENTNNVGRPGEGVANMNYLGPKARWDRLPSEGVQCNQEDVDFSGGINDTFSHNNKRCVVTYTGPGSIGSQTYKTDCSGHVTGIDHGINQLDSHGEESCGVGTGSGTRWDTDIRFEPPDPDVWWTDVWAGRTSWSPLVIKTTPYHPVKMPPLKNADPQHYVIKCDCKPYAPATHLKESDKFCFMDRDLTSGLGCHAKPLSSKSLKSTYYHICGQSSIVTGNSGKASAKVDGSYGVYAPEGESCKHIPCEPKSEGKLDQAGPQKDRDLICCREGEANGASNACGGGSDRTCVQNNYPNGFTCSDPKVGDDQDANSGCAGPLGLFKCTYAAADCQATAVSDVKADHCGAGLKKDDPCSFTVSGSCSSGSCLYGTVDGGTSDCTTTRTEQIDPTCTVNCATHDVIDPKPDGDSCSVTLDGKCLAAKPTTSVNGSPCGPRNKGPANGAGEFCQEDRPPASCVQCNCPDGSTTVPAGTCPDMKLCNGTMIKASDPCVKCDPTAGEYPSQSYCIAEHINEVSSSPPTKYCFKNGNCWTLGDVTDCACGVDKYTCEGGGCAVDESSKRSISSGGFEGPHYDSNRYNYFFKTDYQWNCVSSSPGSLSATGCRFQRKFCRGGPKGSPPVDPMSYGGFDTCLGKPAHEGGITMQDAQCTVTSSSNSGPFGCSFIGYCDKTGVWPVSSCLGGCHTLYCKTDY